MGIFGKHDDNRITRLEKRVAELENDLDDVRVIARRASARIYKLTPGAQNESGNGKVDLIFGNKHE
jgi:hypothetical protein